MIRSSVVLVALVLVVLTTTTTAVAAARADKTLAPKSNEPAKLGTIRCRLYEDNCHIDLAVDEAYNFGDGSTLNSSNTRIFEWKEPHLEAIQENGSSSKANEVYEVSIVPKQVGRAELVALVTDKTSGTPRRILIAHVVITRPYRGIDVAFDVFLWVYVGLVSFVMGASINKDLINFILTGPRQKEVGLAFFCQSFLMPMVSVTTN